MGHKPHLLYIIASEFVISPVRRFFPLITVNGDPMEWHNGLTVRGMLKKKNWTFPMIAVWINDKPVHPDHFDMEEIPDGSIVQAIHMVAGG